MYKVRILIIFTAVGISFLCRWRFPQASGSITWSASACSWSPSGRRRGRRRQSFQSDWLWENNFVTSLGAGGLLAFSAAALVKMAAERAGALRQAAAAQGRKLSAAHWVVKLPASMGWGGLRLPGFDARRPSPG